MPWVTVLGWAAGRSLTPEQVGRTLFGRIPWAATGERWTNDTPASDRLPRQRTCAEVAQSEVLRVIRDLFSFA